jgi:phosphate uptake regulator
MAEKAVDMLHRAMTSFADEDLRTAKDIIQEDDMIDECHSRLYHQAVHNVLGDPRNIERANYMIGVAHPLERLGDRVTSVCEGNKIRPAHKNIPQERSNAGQLGVRETQITFQGSIGVNLEMG